MKKLIHLILFFSAVNLFAGEYNSPLPGNFEKFELKQKSFRQMDSVNTKSTNKIKAFKRGLLSAAVPGLGQYLNKAYWRAAIYAGLEIAAISTYFIYDSKGRDKDKEMMAYGDENWSEHKYWSRLYYLAEQDPEIELPAELDYLFLVDQTDGWKLLNTFDKNVADDLRFLERELGYSHTLPSTNTQQYYEMIYKYPGQFANAWTGGIFDYEYREDGKDLPATALEYRDLRNLTEEFFDVATTATWIILLNHTVSALDAMFTTNKEIAGTNLSFESHKKLINYERVKFYGVQFEF